MATLSAEASMAKVKSPCVILHPLKGFSISIGSLRERYSEDTADVFFVDKETKERLPAHREVLKVASAVFFKMFDGDWKEKEEREIPAPEEYKWESFKAAIALLYGEEVEVEEASIVDVYRVAHCYDLGEVLPVIAHEISQWGESLLDIALELCVVAPEEKELVEAVVKLIAVNLEKIQKMPLKWSNLSYSAMLMLVQSNDIAAAEVTLLDLLNKWTECQPKVPFKKVQDLYSHIRYGIIPYEMLLSCVTHKNLFTMFQMHQCLTIDQVKENLIQLTPRPLQNDVFQVYPMSSHVAVGRQKGKWQFMECVLSRPVGVIYTGKQECCFEINFRVQSGSYPSVAFELTSIYNVANEDQKANQGAGLRKKYSPPIFPTTISGCHLLLVTLSPRGAYIMAQGREIESYCYASEKRHLKCSGDFPWLFTLNCTSVGMAAALSISVRHPV